MTNRTLEKGLTNSQYDSLFDEVITSNLSQSLPEDYSPRKAISPGIVGSQPTETAVMDNSRNLSQQSNIILNDSDNVIHDEKHQTQNIPNNKQILTPENISSKKISTLKHKINKSATKKSKLKRVASPKKVRKQKVASKRNDDISLHEAITIIKDSHTESSLNDSFSMELYENALSQPSSQLSHREKLEWLQQRRNVGVWVYCDKQGCNKLRWLENVKDPTDLPDKWYCEMNPGE